MIGVGAGQRYAQEQVRSGERVRSRDRVGAMIGVGAGQR